MKQNTNYNPVLRAELAFSLTLSLVKNIPRAYDSVKQFEWDSSRFFGPQLKSMIAGVVGYGESGKMYADYCRAFFDKVVICDPYQESAIFALERVNFDQLLEVSDVISLHVPLTRETERMIDSRVISRLKPEGSYLINVSDARVINDSAILSALEDGRLLGYATDAIDISKDKPITVNEFVGPAQRLNVIINPGKEDKFRSGR